MGAGVLTLCAALAGWAPQACLAQAAGPTPAQGRQAYDIPPGPLAPALRQLASTAHVLLTFTDDQTAGRSAPGVRGEHTAQGALEVLLAGTGLEVVPIDGGGFVLRAQPPAPGGAASAAGAGGTAASRRADPTLPSVTVKAARESSRELPPAYAGGQVARGAATGILGATDYMANPYSQTSITAEQIRKRLARTLTEAVAGDPFVVNVYQTPGYYAERLLVRGFNVNQTTQSDILFNGLYGLATNYVNSADVLERVEILKGPNALLNGAAPSGSLGAAVNMVPKRAGDRPLARLSADDASDSQVGVHADLGRRFGDDGEWGLRFNGRHADGDTTTDGNRSGARLGALALDYRGPRGRASLDLIDQRNRTRRLPSYVAFWSYEDTVLPPAPDPRINTSDPNAWSREHNRMLLLTAELALGERWTAYAAAGRSKWNYTASEVLTEITDRSGDSTRSVNGFNIDTDRRSYRLGIRGETQTGPVAHRSVLNLDRYSARQYDCMNWQDLAAGNIYQPAGGAGSSLVPPTRSYGCADEGWFSSRAQKVFDSVALADTMTLLDGRLVVVAGLRYQRIRVRDHDGDDSLMTAYDRGAWTPTLATLWKFSPAWSVYVNSIEGLAAGDVAPSLDESPDVLNPGQSLPPYKTRQREIGLKFDSGTLGATLAWFRADEPRAAVGLDNVFAVNGKRRVDGLELGVFGQPRTGLRLLGGGTLLDVTLRQTADRVNEGHRGMAVPRYQVKLDAEWDVPGASGLTLNGGVVRLGRQYANDENTLWIADSTVWNLGARYEWRVGERPVTLHAAVHNLTGRRYWGAVADYQGLFVGAPRTVLLSVSIDL